MEQMMTEHTARPADLEARLRALPADPGPLVPYDADGHALTLAEAEHVLRGMYAIEPDYFASLMIEVKLGRPLNLGAVSKARKTAGKDTAAEAG